MKKVLLLFSLVIAACGFSQNFPHYVELNIGETVTLKDFPPVTLVSKKVTFRDAATGRIGAAQATLKVGNSQVVVPVGYENSDIIVGTVRIGVEVISDYEEEFTNQRFHLEKDARIRIAVANQPLMQPGSHIYPLFVPWNNGSRTQGWLTACYNIDGLEGTAEAKIGRHHDGFDFGAWEGQLVRSVCTGRVVSASDYPALLENGLLYDKNDGGIGGNPFLIKQPDLPILFYYTHLSGLTRNFAKGETIHKGEPLGYASSRGSSGGWYHLHFSMIHIDDLVHINPYPFLAEWYKETMTHYQDFLTVYKVYYSEDMENEDVLVKVLAGKMKPIHKFSNSLPGVIHLREAIAGASYSGLNHIIHNKYAVLEGEFSVPSKMNGELWFGHSGKARLFLNGIKVYDGELENKYHKSKQPLQTDSLMFQCEFKKGVNKIVIAIEQTDVNWSFSLRPRTRLGTPLN